MWSEIDSNFILMMKFVFCFSSMFLFILDSSGSVGNSLCYWRLYGVGNSLCYWLWEMLLKSWFEQKSSCHVPGGTPTSLLVLRRCNDAQRTRAGRRCKSSITYLENAKKKVISLCGICFKRGKYVKKFQFATWLWCHGKLCIGYLTLSQRGNIGQ